MSNIVERNRTRLIYAKMTEVSKRGYMEPVHLPDGKTTTIDLEPEILKKALIKLFERPAMAVSSLEDAEIKISTHYRNCLSRNFEKLNETGNAFIASLLSNLVEQAFAEKGNGD
ncbi:hypothetical protein IFU23_13925 [Pantoea agglomerans]|uniref:hypothetical protein n=1 Tax=Enterobacter agglomerans TaxID=549 RepID=UPI00177FFBF3|nr:hypothetical protein [Pantoea agglomerans]MBD8159199.1 hypothetical protein [Pantoea agglomerans]MBD8230281.1 hypothetical protein [Pantoea agglomerans]